MRRGQITLFVIIGIIVLILFLFILLIRNVTITQPFNPNAFGTPYDATLIEGYVGTCMDLVSDEAFTKLGQQGGLLYESQGGLHTYSIAHPPVMLAPQPPAPAVPFQFFATPSSLDWPIHDVSALDRRQPNHVWVSFGLVNDSGYAARPPDRAPPEYPVANTAIADLEDALRPWSARSRDGPFGQFALPKLCDSTGPNAMNPLHQNIRCPAYLQPLPLNPVHGPSIQESLTEYVENGMLGCLEQTELESRLGTSVEIVRPNASVVMTENRVTLDIVLPLALGSADGALRFGQFTRQYDVRLYKVYQYLFHLIKAASKRPYFSFNESTNYTSITPHYDGFVVQQQRVRNISSGRQDLFLVTVTDPYSTVGKTSWAFQFLVQNRRPVLDQYNGLTLDEMSPADPPVLVVVDAFDPDGESLTAHLTRDLNPIPPHPNYPPLFGFDVEGVPCPAPNEGKPCLLFRDTPGPGFRDVRLLVVDRAGARDWQDLRIEIISP